MVELQKTARCNENFHKSRALNPQLVGKSRTLLKSDNSSTL